MTPKMRNLLVDCPWDLFRYLNQTFRHIDKYFARVTVSPSRYTLSANKTIKFFCVLLSVFSKYLGSFDSKS